MGSGDSWVDGSDSLDFQLKTKAGWGPGGEIKPGQGQEAGCQVRIKVQDLVPELRLLEEHGLYGQTDPQADPFSRTD